MRILEAFTDLVSDVDSEFDGQQLAFGREFTEQHFEVFAVYGVFLPGEFYEIEINKVAGTALGSADPQDFFAFTAGAASCSFSSPPLGRSNF